MSRISVTHGIGDLAADLQTIGRKAPRELSGVVRSNIRTGNRLAKGYAKQSAGAHGRLYHLAFTSEMRGVAGFSGGVLIYSGEYGPDASRSQGGMSFERGSRNQPPHNDLAKSSDIIGPAFAHDVGRKADSLFWPES